MPQSIFCRKDIEELIYKLSPSTILDIGCSKDALKQATHLIDYIDNADFYPGKKFIVQDLNANQILPFTNKSIDFVFCSHILEHLDSPIKLINEMNRVGKSGVVIVPTKFEDNFSMPDAIIDGNKYLSDRYGHKWWFDYGKNGILEISERQRVIRSLPNHIYEKEIKPLRSYMPNIFELCISWSDELLIKKVDIPKI